MTAKPSYPDVNQYGLKQEDGHGATKQPYGNRAGGERPGVGPADVVDASGHREGKIEEHASPKPSSRMGRADIGETDDKKR